MRPTRYLPVIFLAVWTGIAFSQENPIKQNPKGAEKKAKTEQRGTEKSPLSVKGEITTRTSKEEAESGAKERKEKFVLDEKITEYTGLSALFAGLLFVVSCGQAGLFIWQLSLMQGATRAAEAAAKAADTSANAVMLAERAYVKMSHAPPGVYWGEPDKDTCMVTVQVLNYGRTPTNVTDVVLCPVVLPNAESLPKVPDYRTKQGRQIPSGFLMPGDWFTHTGHFNLFDKLADVKDRSSHLFVIGYVDYIDVFKKRHRGGYARAYIRAMDDGTQNNLVLVTQQGYNYDRPREKGEGNDWNT